MAAARRRYGLRDALVVMQLATSVILLVGAGLFVRSLQAAYSVPIGFNREGVLLASFNPPQQGMTGEDEQVFYRESLERVTNLPGVTAAAFAAFYPVQRAGGRTSVTVEGYQPQDGEDMELSLNIVTPGYFATLEIPILQGETFSERHQADAPGVAIVNQTFVDRYWPGENAIGKRISLTGPSGPWLEVIGLATNGKYRNIRGEPIPYFYIPVPQASFLPPLTLGVRSVGEPTDILPAIRNTIRSLHATMPLINVHTLRQHLGNHLAQERTTTVLVGALGLLALIVASVGVYGVMAYTVSQRVQEIGIRTALGASGSDVLQLVVGHGFRLAVVGVALGAVGALMLSRTIESFLFGVTPTDPITFVAVTLTLGLVAFVASFIPARRAAKVDPMLALRYE